MTSEAEESVIYAVQYSESTGKYHMQTNANVLDGSVNSRDIVYLQRI